MSVVPAARVHHIGLSVGDIDAAEEAFYAAVLPFLGYRKAGSLPHVSFWVSDSGAQPIHLLRSQAAAPPADHHCAFVLGSREEVDQLHGLLVEVGADLRAAPQDYPHFGPGHYAVFFADPIGRLFEVLHRADAVPLSGAMQQP